MKKKAFTLIESLVAVTILTIAAAGPLFAASRAIVAAAIARDQLTASLLAQEGIEYTRYWRDAFYWGAYQSDIPTATTVGWTNFVSYLSTTGCDTTSVSTHACTVDPQSQTYASCTIGSCAPLYLDTSSGMYTQTATGGTKTKFTRTIQSYVISANEERIVSTVSWSYGGVTYSVTNTDHLTPWQ